MTRRHFIGPDYYTDELQERWLRIRDAYPEVGFHPSGYGWDGPGADDLLAELDALDASPEARDAQEAYEIDDEAEQRNERACFRLGL